MTALELQRQQVPAATSNALIKEKKVVALAAICLANTVLMFISIYRLLVDGEMEALMLDAASTVNSLGAFGCSIYTMKTQSQWGWPFSFVFKFNAVWFIFLRAVLPNIGGTAVFFGQFFMIAWTGVTLTADFIAIRMTHIHYVEQELYQRIAESRKNQYGSLDKMTDIEGGGLEATGSKISSPPPPYTSSDETESDEERLLHISRAESLHAGLRQTV